MDQINTHISLKQRQQVISYNNSVHYKKNDTTDVNTQQQKSVLPVNHENLEKSYPKTRKWFNMIAGNNK